MLLKTQYATVKHMGNFAGKVPMKDYTVDVSEYRSCGEVDVLLPESVTKKYGKTIRIVSDNEVLTEVTYIKAAEPGQDVIEGTEEIRVCF